MNNINCVSKQECTGCGACKNACTFDAIKFHINAEGFYYPTIDVDKCINCGICRQACPVLNRNKWETNVAKECYAVMADDVIRAKSSSGGAFAFFANYVLEQNGVVCGVSYTNGYNKAIFKIVERKEELTSLFKSKYVQSDIGYVFRDIKKFLLDGRKVLFCGCPCQVAGLKTYLNKEYPTLLTIDILCHGVGSITAWQSYLKEISKGRTIVSLDFRSKEKDNWGSYALIKFNDGSDYYKNYLHEPWYQGFLNGITIRESCGNCMFANRNRVGDFSIGDFWGADKQNRLFDDKKGTSLVLVNTNKAKMLIREIKGRLKLCAKADLELAAQNNNILNFPYSAHPYRFAFFDKLPRLGYHRSLRYITNKYDIGILGFWNGNNYGSALTYFALAKVIEDEGFSVCFIEEPMTKPENANRSLPSYVFINKHFNIKSYNTFDGLLYLNTMFSCFLLGSDQVFAYPCIQNRECFFNLYFADDDKIKIAYASSFGHDKILHPANRREMFKMSMGRFTGISVREKSGVKLCEQFGLSSKWVLDPIFLLDKSEYVKMAQQSSIKKEEPFILAYILDPDDNKRELILSLEKKLNMRATVILTGMDNFAIQKNLMNLDDRVVNIAQMEDFYYLYANTSFVVTDSYHGTCMALINRKNFISLENAKRGITRLDSLKEQFNIGKNVFHSAKDAIKNRSVYDIIDYNAFDYRLNTLKMDSMHWLLDMLNKVK